LLQSILSLRSIHHPVDRYDDALGRHSRIADASLALGALRVKLPAWFAAELSARLVPAAWLPGACLHQCRVCAILSAVEKSTWENTTMSIQLPKPEIQDTGSVKLGMGNINDLRPAPKKVVLPPKDVADKGSVRLGMGDINDLRPAR
jgi:hypothetical protein